MGVRQHSVAYGILQVQPLPSNKGDSGGSIPMITHWSIILLIARLALLVLFLVACPGTGITPIIC